MAACAQVKEDMLRYFPRIHPSHVSIRQIDSHDHILSAFDRTIAMYATEHFQRSGIDLILSCRVCNTTCFALWWLQQNCIIRIDSLAHGKDMRYRYAQPLPHSTDTSTSLQSSPMSHSYNHSMPSGR